MKMTNHFGITLVHWFLHTTVIRVVVLVTQDVFTPSTTHPTVFRIVLRVAYSSPLLLGGGLGRG